VTARAGIADNPRPLLVRTIVQKLSPDLVCLCVHGATPCSAAWLDAAIAQLPEGARLVLVGANASVAAYPDALRLAAMNGDDIVPMLAAVATHLPGHDVVVLRNDVDLPAHAVARLLHALEHPGVFAVGALDNLDPTRSPLPTGTNSDASTQHIDALCYAYSTRRLIDSDRVSPLASAWHGGRLAHVGAANLDQAASGLVPDLRVVALDHLYVAARARLLRGAAADSDPRDPSPPSPLAGLRESVGKALGSRVLPACAGLDARPVLLHILHGWGGGAERWVRDFCSASIDATHLVLIARGSHARRRHGEWLELYDGSMIGPPLRRIALPRPIADTALADAAYRNLLDALILEHAVDAVIVSSLIGHSLDALRTSLPTLRVIHDHYPLWPVLHRDFGDPALRFDDTQRIDDLAALGSDREFTNSDPTHWKQLRDATVAALIEANAVLVAPSRSALDNDLRLAPELGVLAGDVIPHGLGAWPAHAPRATQPPLRPRLRLVIPGRVRRGKGAQLLEQILPRLREHAEIFLLGAGTDAHAFFGERSVHIVLDYQRAELPDLLARLAPDAALLLPTVAETFGYTLSELRDLGLPVIATRMGALVERIEDGIDGFLVEASADAIVARIAALASTRDPLAHVRANLATRREPDLPSMAHAYAAVLKLPVRKEARYPLATIDATTQQLAARTIEVETSRRREHELRAQLDILRVESNQRGDWGHALDRELGDARKRIDGLHVDLQARTEWALGLDAEVNALNAEINTLRPFKPSYETVIASRSWRLTAPLRSAAARLRNARAKLAFRKARLTGVLRRVRGSLAQHGIAGTWARIVRELRGATPTMHAREQFDAPGEDFTPFAVPVSTAPQVSIIIPVHNKFAYTAACLRSLTAHAAAIPFEVIVVDDLSNDRTAQGLSEIDGVRVIRNAENLGFVGSCNAGAAVARGEFVLFLNNDTVVTSGWLEALVRCFDEEADAGLVGARLVYPDGRLQEAGGIVFNDGSGWNYGRFDDPDDARYTYRREADYCSGAAILLRRALFEQLGRFDQRYAPAYYEDTDLAFAVRAAGFKVYYEPRSRVVHFEGVSAGTDTGSGMKRYQVINREKFLDKWRDALRAQPAPGTTINLAATHRAKRRILIIDATTPTPDQDSGSLRMVNLMRVLRRNTCHVVFMASNRAWIERYTDDLQELGIEVLYHPFTADPVALFRERGKEFDAIVLSRHYVAAEYLGLARLYAPKARLIFDTVDLHYLRELRAAELEGKPELARIAAATRAQELKIMRECDVTLVVSPVEQEILARDAPGVHVDVLSNVHEIHGCRRSFHARHDLVFVGGFQHPPNIDAVLWFVNEVFPRVREALPDLRFHVIGSKVTEAIRLLGDEHVIVHGFVDDIAPYMDDCRISLAPLRYGAGVKGKVNMAMSYGLPVVATTMAVEGMHVRFGEDVLVADDAAGHAATIVALYNDEVLWNRLSTNGLANVREHFSFEAAETAIRRIIGF
jgi:GT2 family glycosyltransferase